MVADPEVGAGRTIGGVYWLRLLPMVICTSRAATDPHDRLMFAGSGEVAENTTSLTGSVSWWPAYNTSRFLLRTSHIVVVCSCAVGGCWLSSISRPVRMPAWQIAPPYANTRVHRHGSRSISNVSE